MSYPQPPLPGQGPQWQGGGYAPQYSPAPPPPPRNSAGVVVLVVGGVVIVVLVVAIVLVFTLGGSGSGGTPTADSPRPQESTSDRTPEDDASTPDVLGDDSDWIPDDIPDDVPEAPGGGLAAGEFPEDMDGDWKGTMTQYGLDGTFQSTWVLDVHMAAGESTGSAELSLENDRSCQWDIITTGNTEETVDLEYHTTDDGNGSCTPFGYLHFIVDGDNLYVGVASEQPDGSLSTADGVLTRY